MYNVITIFHFVRRNKSKSYFSKVIFSIYMDKDYTTERNIYFVYNYINLHIFYMKNCLPGLLYNSQLSQLTTHARNQNLYPILNSNPHDRITCSHVNIIIFTSVIMFLIFLVDFIFMSLLCYYISWSSSAKCFYVKREIFFFHLN